MVIKVDEPSTPRYVREQSEGFLSPDIVEGFSDFVGHDGQGETHLRIHDISGNAPSIRSVRIAEAL